MKEKPQKALGCQLKFFTVCYVRSHKVLFCHRVFGVLPMGSVVQAFPVPALMGFPSIEIYLDLSLLPGLQSHLLLESHPCSVACSEEAVNPQHPGLYPK